MLGIVSVAKTQSFNFKEPKNSGWDSFTYVKLKIGVQMSDAEPMIRRIMLMHVITLL